MKYMDKKEFDKANMFGLGAPNGQVAAYFSGNVFLNPLLEEGQAPVFPKNVTFEPGCRNNWHVHHAKSGGGQLLICTAGEGWYQEEGKDAVSLQEGSLVHVPAEVKHWHGAKADSWFAHISMGIPGVDASGEWLGPVADEDYDKLV